MQRPSPLVPYHLEGEDPSYLVVGGLLFDVLSGKLEGPAAACLAAAVSPSKTAALAGRQPALGVPFVSAAHQ